MELNALKAIRPIVTRDDFVAEFSSLGVRRELLDETYEYVVAQLPVRDFPVLPNDSLRDVYKIGDWVPLIDIAEDILVGCGGRRPTREDWRNFGPIGTVSDLVRFLGRIDNSPPR